ncbi:hypothetical protein LC612_07565 [Nostoc sp. CHAB 5834]|nr:hypothetical protein [Nostoc sp. CHAB 5834]
MVELSLTDIFGAGATQDASTITIQKSSLPRLTPSANNTAESLFTGIVLKGQTNLTQTNFDTNIDQSIYIGNGFPSFTNRGVNNEQYRIDQLTINLAKLDTGSVIDPDDY